MWGYMDAYTTAQIELMAMDCPITVLDRKRKKGKDGKTELPRPKASDVLESGKRWENKYKGKSAEVKIDLGGFSLK